MMISSSTSWGFEHTEGIEGLVFDLVDVLGARGEGDGVRKGDRGRGGERRARHMGMDGGARVGRGDVYSKLDAHWARSNGRTRIRTW